jgi:hypothetical protein
MSLKALSISLISITSSLSNRREVIDAVHQSKSTEIANCPIRNMGAPQEC